jgi:cold shock CspA family protein
VSAGRDLSTGTIADLDKAGAFGVIDADDGRVLLFNLKGIPPSRKRRFSVGKRVEFEVADGPIAPRALGLRIARVRSEWTH